MVSFIQSILRIVSLFAILGSISAWAKRVDVTPAQLKNPVGAPSAAQRTPMGIQPQQDAEPGQVAVEPAPPSADSVPSDYSESYTNDYSTED